MISHYGAGMSNMIFMKSGSSALELQKGNLVRDDYQRMASCCSINYQSLPIPNRVFPYANRFLCDDFIRLSESLALYF